MMSDQRGAFEKWARERWGSHAYLHTSNTSGEWDAWQAALTQPQAQQAKTCHDSDCSVHNEPAYPAGPCDCGFEAQQAAAVPACDYWATIAGLESSVGRLSALVDQQRDLLAEVEDIFGRDGHGGRLEDGESELIDRIRSHLEMIAAPAAPPSPVLPLSDEQIESLLVNWPKDGIAFIDFARAIEAAHGITEPGAGREST